MLCQSSVLYKWYLIVPVLWKRELTADQLLKTMNNLTLTSKMEIKLKIQLSCSRLTGEIFSHFSCIILCSY